jgi:hypothetical protein
LPETFVFESGRQFFHHRPAFRVAHGKPGADFFQAAPASLAQAGPGVIGADLGAGAFHFFVYAVFGQETQSFQADRFKMGNGLNRGLTAHP